jgi:hypothetical protein
MTHPNIRIIKLAAVSEAGTETCVYQVQTVFGSTVTNHGKPQMMLRYAEVIRDVWIKNREPEVVG